MGSGGGQGSEWLNAIVASLGMGQPLHMLLTAALIIFFAFFYTALVFNPKETPITCASMAASCRAFVPAKRRPNTSTTS